jgi:hypothetical protein
MSIANFNNDPELFTGLRALILRQEEDSRDYIRIMDGQVLQIDFMRHGSCVARFDDDKAAAACLSKAGWVKLGDHFVPEAPEVVLLTAQGVGRALSAREGMEFKVLRVTINGTRRIVHVVDERPGMKFQIWSLGPEDYQSTKGIETPCKPRETESGKDFNPLTGN